MDVDNPARARLEIAAARMKGGKALHSTRADGPGNRAGATRTGGRGAGVSFPVGFSDKGPVARHTLSQALSRIIERLPDAKAIQAPYPTPHDFRRTVATGLSALGVPREDRLAVLAHAQDDVHGIHYDKYDRLAEKRGRLRLGKPTSRASSGRTKRRAMSSRSAPADERAFSPEAGRTVRLRR